MTQSTSFLVLGIEGSANKIAAGIVGYDGTIFSNVRKTHVTPPGSGFIPRETQKHHAEYVVRIIEEALLAAHIVVFPHSVTSPPKHLCATERKKAIREVSERITCISYTRGPGMAGCLSVGATVTRVLAQLWGKQAANQAALHELRDFVRDRSSAKLLEELPENAFASVISATEGQLLPIIGVNHCVAHIEMGRLAGEIQPTRGAHSIFQALDSTASARDSVVVLYVSGGNTQVITYSAQRYHIVGETIDIAVGNCIDRVARLLGVSNDPCAGANIERLARVGRRRYEAFRAGSLDASGHKPNFLSLPYVVKGMDMSFSGLLSFCKELLYHENFRPEVQPGAPEENLFDWAKGTEASAPKRKPMARIEVSEPFDIYDLCWSIEEHVFAALVEVTERALCLSGASDILIVGGVGCNEQLQAMMRKMADQQNSPMESVPNISLQIPSQKLKNVRSHDMDERYCIDNGCMIAYTGALEHIAHIQYENAGLLRESEELSTEQKLQSVSVCQRYRTDDVWIGWYDA